MWFSSFRLKLRISAIHVALNREGFHRADEKRWIFKHLQRHCKLLISLRFELMNFVYAISLFCFCFYLLNVWFSSESYVVRNRLISWKHRPDVFRWECTPVHSWICLTLVCRAATGSSCCGFQCSGWSLPASFMSLLADLSLHRKMSISQIFFITLLFDGWRYFLSSKILSR